MDAGPECYTRNIGIDKYEVVLGMTATFVATESQRATLEAIATRNLKHSLYAGVIKQVYAIRRANSDPEVDRMLSDLLKEIES